MRKNASHAHANIYGRSFLEPALAVSTMSAPAENGNNGRGGCWRQLCETDRESIVRAQPFRDVHLTSWSASLVSDTFLCNRVCAGNLKYSLSWYSCSECRSLFASSSRAVLAVSSSTVLAISDFQSGKIASKRRIYNTELNGEHGHPT